MPSAWITHVKNYANENNCSYKEALSKASASYKKQKGEGCCDKLKEWRGRKQSKINPERNYTPEEEKKLTLKESSRNPPKTTNTKQNKNREKKLKPGIDIDYDITEETPAQLLAGEGKKKKKKNKK